MKVHCSSEFHNTSDPGGNHLAFAELEVTGPQALLGDWNTRRRYLAGFAGTLARLFVSSLDHQSHTEYSCCGNVLGVCSMSAQ